jgi:hypothetical protein
MNIGMVISDRPDNELLAMWRSITARMFPAALALLVTAAPAWAQPQNTTLSSPEVAIRSLPVSVSIDDATAKITDAAVHLVAAQNATKFGLSVRATMTPKTGFTGKERPIVYLYPSCDNEPPARTRDVPVAVVALGALDAGEATQTVITTATGEALLPSAGIACAKLAVVCKDCGEPPAARPTNVELPLPAPVQESDAPLEIDRAAVTLAGESGSKSFSLSFDGLLTPTKELTGKEKLVVDLYAACTGATPGFFAGAVEVSDLPADKSALTVRKTATATSIVALSRVGCAKLDVTCASCEPPSPPAEGGIQRPALAEPGIGYLSFKDLSLALVGDPASKEFGVAVDGTATPKVNLTGNEKPVIRLYTGCSSADGKTNVATVELTNLPKDSANKPVKLTATNKTEAFVPMQDIDCAVLDVLR